MHSERKRGRSARIVRWASLGGVLALSAGLGLLHQQETAAFKPAGVDALCPFRGLETLWALVSGGTLLSKIALSSIVLLVPAEELEAAFAPSANELDIPLKNLKEACGFTMEEVRGYVSAHDAGE